MNLNMGSLTILGKNTRRMDERSWFQFVEKLGIYNSQPVFQESASIGENVASLYRMRSDLMEEPQLSASVLSLANLVQLSITDLSRQMSEATPVQRMKVRIESCSCLFTGVVDRLRFRVDAFFRSHT